MEVLMPIKALTFLKISAIISKIGNYFYHKHVMCVKTKTRESINGHTKAATGNRSRRGKCK